jgi:hypothetical protein
MREKSDVAQRPQRKEHATPLRESCYQGLFYSTPLLVSMNTTVWRETLPVQYCSLLYGEDGRLCDGNSEHSCRLNASSAFAEGSLESTLAPGFGKIHLHSLQPQAAKVLFSSQTGILDMTDFIHNLSQSQDPHFIAELSLPAVPRIILPRQDNTPSL